MNRDDIIRMAREAEIPGSWDLNWFDPYLERFAKLVVAHEREECAKVCEEQMKAYMSSQYTTDPLGGFRERFATERCAAAIRARGEK